MTMTAALVSLPPRGRGRPSNADLVDRNRSLEVYNADLRLEIAQLKHELGVAGTVMAEAGRRLGLAYQAERFDLMGQVAGRLVMAGRSASRKAVAE